MHSMGKSVFVQDIVSTTNGNTIRHSIKCANQLGMEPATPPPPLGGEGGVGVSPWDTPLYPYPAQVVKTFFRKKIVFFRSFFLDVFQIVKRKVQVEAKKNLKKNRSKDVDGFDLRWHSLFMVINASPEISAEDNLRDLIALSPLETKEANDWFDMVEDRWLDSMNEE